LLLSRLRGTPWGTVAILWFAFALNYIDRQIVFVIYPALRHDLGFSEMQLGLAGAVFLWVYALSMPLAGAVADRVSRRRMIVASIFLWSLATLGSGIGASVVSFVCWRAVIGLSEALYFPAAVSLIRSLHPDTARSRALSVHQTAQLAGIVAGGWVGGWLADRVGWRAGFLILGGLGIFYAAIVAGGLREPRTSDHRPSRSRIAFPALRLSWCYCVLLVAFFAFCATLWLFYSWYPDHLNSRYRISMAASGISGTVFLQGSSAVGMLLGGFLADRLSRSIPPARFYLCGLGILLSAPFAYLAFATWSLAEASWCSAGFGFFAGWMMANIFAAAYDVVPANQSGFAAGVLNTAGGLSGAAMIFAGGLVKNSIGIPGVMAWSAAITGTLGLLLIVIAARHFMSEVTRGEISEL
jgi:MFS family permease